LLQEQQQRARRELGYGVAQHRWSNTGTLRFNDAGMAARERWNDCWYHACRRQYQVLTTITDSNLQNSTARTKTIQIRVVPLERQQHLGSQYRTFSAQ
jgi:hypothetical protein